MSLEGPDEVCKRGLQEDRGFISQKRLRLTCGQKTTRHHCVGRSRPRRRCLSGEAHARMRNDK